MPTQLPKWLTKVIAALVLVAAYLVHAENLIPSTLVWHLGPIPIHALAGLNDIVLFGGMVGISGPAILPRLAALLGNPSAGAVNDAARALDKPVPTAAKP